MAKKLKILLIIEDEEPLLNILNECFKKSDFEVIRAHNGEEGLREFKKKRPNLILLDLLMPVMDGMAMLRKLREDKDGKKVPVVILTNLSDEQKMDEAKKLGVVDYWIKSDKTLNELIEKVKIIAS